MEVKQCKISDHINTHYRDYAIYVLEKRGIPNWYDGLTPVQRQILTNTPTTTTKTLSVVGKVIQNNYKHGDASLAKAINKLARTYNTSKNLLDGEGFFGTPVTPRASSPRYTDIKLSNEISNDIKQYNNINVLNEDEKYNYLNVEYPIGLLTNIVGIAIGYKTSILPRSKQHITSYLKGNRKTVKPSFINFNGSVSKVPNESSTWLISAKLDIDYINKKIEITDLPPLMKLSSFLIKLEKIKSEISENERIKIENNSDEYTKINITYKGDNFKGLLNVIDKKSKLIIKESILFVKDGKVIQYEKIEDYLDDFKVHINYIKYQYLKYLETTSKLELKYYKAKLKFLEFMMLKKRSRNDINVYLNKYESNISNRLCNLKMYVLDTKTIEETKSKIEILKQEVSKYLNDKKIQYKLYIDFKKTHKSKQVSNIDDSDYISNKGIETYNVVDTE